MNTSSIMKYSDIQIVFYHSPCQDGLASAWVASKYAKENNLTYTFVAIGNDSTEFGIVVENKNVLFVDYAPSDYQLDLLKKATEFVILDHHKTNADRLKTMPNAIFDMNKSGVGLTWKYFYPDIEIPLFLAMIQDRDIWTWKIPDSRPFCDGFFNYTYLTDTVEEAFKLFDEVYSSQDKFKEILNIGVLLEKKKDKQVKNIARLAKEKIYMYNGYKACIVNCDHELASDLGNYILRTSDCDFTVCWRYNHSKEEYWMSLRADNKVDVSEICQKYGGGGHKNAAGCTSKIHPSVLFTQP